MTMLNENSRYAKACFNEPPLKIHP